MGRYMSLKDHVYKYISEKINIGELKPDDKINEQKICTELGISRTPIREALIQLASDGYLYNQPRRGFRVKYLSVKKVRDLYEIIGTLDGHAAAKSVDHITEEDLSKMRFLADSMETSIRDGHGNTYYELQVKFHDVYLARCGNEELPKALEQLKNNFFRKFYIFEDPNNEAEVLLETNQQHFEIIRLFEDKQEYELERFIRDVHWASDKAQFDSLPQSF